MKIFWFSKFRFYSFGKFQLSIKNSIFRNKMCSQIWIFRPILDQFCITILYNNSVQQFCTPIFVHQFLKQFLYFCSNFCALNFESFFLEEHWYKNQKRCKKWYGEISAIFFGLESGKNWFWSSENVESWRYKFLGFLLIP